MQIQSPALVVSIHDVAPSTQRIVQEMINDLRQLGVTCSSLLVIPYYHEKESLTQNLAFMEWLQEKEEEGHEIVLHGYSHLRPAAESESCWTRWMTQHYTRGEGEFYDLSYDEARAKLKMGKMELTRIFHPSLLRKPGKPMDAALDLNFDQDSMDSYSPDKNPSSALPHQPSLLSRCESDEISGLRKAGVDLQKIFGFIAPAWLLSQEAERAVIDEGFSYTTRLHGVIDLRNKQPVFYRSQSMVYSVSSAWRRRVSLVWNEFLFRVAEQQAWPLLRLGLHPPDWRYPAIRKQILSVVRRAVIKRSVMTYNNWMKSSF